uniref:LRRNT domain-containing protein n=1 Tax=Chelonoidis abingdonii TaxID=106734 RepID=A0A8C0GRB8_CHEAB
IQQKMRVHYLIWICIHFSFGESEFHYPCQEICLCKEGAKFVNCSGVNVTDNLIFPPETEHLDLSISNLYSVPSKVLRSLWKLQVLLLSGNYITKVGQRAFSSLERLQKLDIHRNEITVLGSSFSTGLSSLRDLNLSYNRLQELYYRNFQHFENLQKNLSLLSVDTQLCIAETVTVLVIAFTVFITVVAAIVMAERNRKKRTGKHWSEDSDISYESQD